MTFNGKLQKEFLIKSKGNCPVADSTEYANLVEENKNIFRRLPADRYVFIYLLRKQAPFPVSLYLVVLCMQHTMSLCVKDLNLHSFEHTIYMHV